MGKLMEQEEMLSWEGRLRPEGKDLWVDVGHLLNWEGTVTGIQRTILHLLQAWLADERPWLRLCGYDRQQQVYRELPRSVLGEILLSHTTGVLGQRPVAPPNVSLPTESTIKRSLRRMLHSLPDDLQACCRDSYRAAHHLLRFVIRRTAFARRPTQQPVAPLVETPGRPLTRFAPAAFAPRDILLLLGDGWADTGCCEVLCQHRDQTGLRIVPLIYDIIPRTCPHFVPGVLHLSFTSWIEKIIGLAECILTISQHARSELLALANELHLTPGPIDVIRLGDELPAVGEEVRPKDLPDGGIGPFVLSVGTLEIRKNPWLPYYLWRRLVERHGSRIPPLVLAGRIGFLTNDLLYHLENDPAVCGRITVLSGATNGELNWLYRHCLFTLSPSHYEGWGLPLAESLAHGKYAISSSASSLPEIADDLIDHHDPLDLPGWVHLVERALFEPGFLGQREQNICARFKITSWQDCAAQILDYLEQRLTVRLREKHRGNQVLAVA